MKLIVKLKNGVDVWKLTPALRAMAQPIAKRLGLSLAEFLTRLSTWQLPGGPQTEITNDLQDDPPSVPAGFRVKPCNDLQVWKRVERAAEFDGISVELFVWKAIASTVVCLEADLISDPVDGRPLGNALELYEFRSRLFQDARLHPLSDDPR
jgi:hypothetical protein